MSWKIIFIQSESEKNVNKTIVGWHSMEFHHVTRLVWWVFFLLAVLFCLNHFEQTDKHMYDAVNANTNAERFTFTYRRNWHCLMPACECEWIWMWNRCTASLFTHMHNHRVPFICTGCVHACVRVGVSVQRHWNRCLYYTQTQAHILSLSMPIHVQCLCSCVYGHSGGAHMYVSLR